MTHSPPKPVVESFLNDWNGRKGWAQANNIPYNDYLNTVRYYWDRLVTTGYSASDTEAFDALAGLKAGKAVFSSPQTTPPNITQGPKGIWGAMENDVAGIVTGLFHFPGTIGHAAIEATKGNFGDLANFIPGYMDIHNLLSPTGRQWMLQHPISDILDVGGLGSEEFAAADAAEAGTADEIAGAARGTIKPDTYVKGGIGGLLYKMGAQDAARMYAKLPDHPFSKSLKWGFNSAANNIDAVARIKAYGSSLAGHIGMFEYQREMFMRPVTAIKNTLGRVPADIMNADDATVARWGNIHLRDTPAGPTLANEIFGQTGALSKFLNTDEEYQRVVQMMNMGKDPVTGLVGQVDLRTSDAIPENIRNAYILLADTEAHLTDVQMYTHSLVQIQNPLTGDVGLEQPDGPFQQYFAKWQKMVGKLARSNNEWALAVNRVRMGTRDIAEENDPTVPPELRRPDESPVSKVVGVNRASDALLERYGKPKVVGKAEVTRYNKVIARTFGPGGRIDDIAFRARSYDNLLNDKTLPTDITITLNAMRRLKAIPHNDTMYTYVETSLMGMRDTIRSVQAASRTTRALGQAKDLATRQANRLTRSMDLNWNRYGEREFAPLVQREMATFMKQKIRDLTSSGNIVRKAVKSGFAIEIISEMADAAIRDIEQGWYHSLNIESIITPGEWIKIRNDAYMMINNWKAKGIQPVFTTATREGAASIRSSMRPMVRASKTAHASVERSITDPLSDSTFDPRLGITKEAGEIYKKALVKEFHDNFVIPKTITQQELITDAKNARLGLTKSSTDIASVGQVAEDYASQMGYVKWNPDDIPEFKQFRVNAPATARYIKQYDLRLIDRSISSTFKELNKAWDAGMQMYRAGVLFLSPRFLAHITLGGATMELLQLNPLWLTPRTFQTAYRMVKEGPSAFPAYMTLGTSYDDLANSFVHNPFGAHDWLASSTMGRLWKDSFAAKMGSKAAGALHGYQTFLENISNMQRALAFVSGKLHIDPREASAGDVAAAKAWGVPLDEWLGVKLSHKVLADRQVFTPLEKGIIRRIMPFWGWTRHIIRYAMKYPIDHPLRAEILTAIANEATGSNSLFPEYLFRLLYLGQPDAQGNVTALDLRQWNPFRDIESYMGPGGFISQLNPLWSGIAAGAFGLDPVTGQPELYPSLTYDSFYGGTAPVGGNILESVAEQFSPQFNTLLGVLQHNSQMRQEAKTNPGKLPYLIADSLGMPWIPFNVNVKQVDVKALQDQYSVISRSIQNALTQNSMADLAGLGGLLPLDDYEVNQNYIDTVIKVAQAEDQAAKTDVPATDLLALQYPTPFIPQYLEYTKAQEQNPTGAQGVSGL